MKKRERGDLIMMYRFQECLENLEREDLVVHDDSGTRGKVGGIR